MPIIKKNGDSKPSKKESRRKERRELRRATLSAEQIQKRAARVAKRKERYSLKRKERKPQDYDQIKVVVDGEEKQVSQGSKFLLDMLIKD